MTDIIHVDSNLNVQELLNDPRRVVDAMDSLLGEVSESTAVTYKPAIIEFLKWARDNTTTHPSAALSQYIKHLRDSGLAASTINKKRSAIRRFFEWSARLGMISQSDLMRVQQVKRVAEKGGKYGSWLTLEQMQELLDLPDDTYIGLRDRAVLAMLVGCAMRRSEVVSVRWEQIKRVGKVWVFENVRRKHGRIQPLLPIPDWVKKVLDAYQSEIKMTRGPIIVRFNRNGTIGGTLSDQSVYNIVKYYVGLLDQGHVTPHDLRRSWARAARENDAELSQIQQVLGHEDVATTQRYVNEILDLEKAAAFVEMDV